MSQIILPVNTVVLGGAEAGYGVDPLLTGAANAIRLQEGKVNLFQGNKKTIKYQGGGMGMEREVRTEDYATLTFKVDLVSSLTPGVAPPIGAYFKACGCSEYILATAATGTCTAGSANTATLGAGASAIDGAYIGAKFRATGGAGSGQKATIIAYNGATKQATFDRTLSTPFDNTTLYSIDPFVRYNLVSDILTMNSAAFYFYTGNALLHKLLGCRGKFSLGIKKNDTPYFQFDMTCLDGGHSDASASGMSYVSFADVLAVNDPITYGQVFGKPFTGGATGLQMNSFDFDQGNQVAYRNNVGYEGVIIGDRSPKGTLDLDAFQVSDFDIWTLAKQSGTSVFGIEHEDKNGGSVRIDLPHFAPGDISEGEDGAVGTFGIPYMARALTANTNCYVTFR